MRKDGVTDMRKFPEKLSCSHNDPYSTDPTTCQWCRQPFRQDQTRFPILTGVNFNTGWEVVSVCPPCFREASNSEATTLSRHDRECLGCGCAMRTPIYYRFQWQVCSNRCYQRALRKRNRPYLRCEACQKSFRTARRDARFCSGACRQRQYRQRKRSNGHGDQAGVEISTSPAEQTAFI